jgi:hypothetical protein
MVPVVVLPPATPFTSQVTTVLVLAAVLEFVRLTTAVKSVVPFSATFAVVGVIATEVTRLLPEPPPHAVRISAQTIASAKQDRAGALFCMGKLFLDIWLLRANRRHPDNGHTAPRAPLEDICATGVARETYPTAFWQRVTVAFRRFNTKFRIFPNASGGSLGGERAAGSSENHLGKKVAKAATGKLELPVSGCAIEPAQAKEQGDLRPSLRRRTREANVLQYARDDCRFLLLDDRHASRDSGVPARP